MYLSPVCRSRSSLLQLYVNSLYPTVLQLSGNIGNLWGRLTPTLNYRLALTASLTAHQPAKPPSQQPSLTLLPPLPLKTPHTCSAGPSLAPHPSFQLTFAILRLMLSMCVGHLLCGCACVLCSSNCFTLICSSVGQKRINAMEKSKRDLASKYIIVKINFLRRFHIVLKHRIVF